MEAQGVNGVSEVDGEGASSPPYHLPQRVADDEPAVTRRRSLRALSPHSHLQIDLEEKSPQEEKDTFEETSPTSENTPPQTQMDRPRSAPKENVSWALTANMEPILPPKKLPPLLGSPTATQQLSKRRITYSVDDISPHALDRLGVNADILKKEKGMKKLGICDVDIVRSEELRRYTGISQQEPHSKVEFMFGFNDEQLHRDKAIKRLGTSEQEILDDYSRRVSRLGIPNTLSLQQL